MPFVSAIMSILLVQWLTTMVWYNKEEIVDPMKIIILLSKQQSVENIGLSVVADASMDAAVDWITVKTR